MTASLTPLESGNFHSFPVRRWEVAGEGWGDTFNQIRAGNNSTFTEEWKFSVKPVCPTHTLDHHVIMTLWHYDTSMVRNSQLKSTFSINCWLAKLWIWFVFHVWPLSWIGTDWIFEAKLGSLSPVGTIFSLTDFKLKLKRPSLVTSPPPPPPPPPPTCHYFLNIKYWN